MKPTVEGTIVFREATAEDYEAVMDINRNVYDGQDYLPDMYHQYIQDPKRYCSLTEINGRVVAFEMLQISDDFTAFTTQAGRVAKSHLGKGIGRFHQNSALRHIMKTYPSLKVWRWTSVNVLESKKMLSAKGGRLITKRHVLQRMTTSGHLRNMMTNSFTMELTQKFPVDDVQHLSPSGAIEVLTRRVDLSKILPEGVWFINNEPYTPLSAHYEHIFKNEKYDLFASQTSKSDQEFSAVSFGSAREVKVGYKYRMDIYCNRDINDIHVVLAHVVKHLIYLLQYCKKGPLILSILLQSEKFRDAVDSFLENVLKVTTVSMAVKIAFMGERTIDLSDIPQPKL